MRLRFIVHPLSADYLSLKTGLTVTAVVRDQVGVVDVEVEDTVVPQHAIKVLEELLSKGIDVVAE